MFFNIFIMFSIFSLCAYYYQYMYNYIITCNKGSREYYDNRVIINGIIFIFIKEFH